jgi:alkaline phosphatase|tara:strand:- start:162 stop:1256 length:1095 start_codon:yes stop_codon:yes gene_type:complete
MRKSQFYPVAIIASILFFSVNCSSANKAPKSIILIVADGAGIGHQTALYYLTDDYAPARFENVGLVTTYMLGKDKVTDSAAGATAMATGYKTVKGAIGMTINESGDTVAAKSVIEYAQDISMATGVVTTSFVNDATPASFSVHHPIRKERIEIAHKMADAGLDVILGAGNRYFSEPLPGSTDTLTAYDKFAQNGIQIISNLVAPIDPSRPVLGIFADKGLPANLDGREPTLVAMAAKALDLVGGDPNGFFLLVEEEGNDSYSHDRDSLRVVGEMQSINEVVNLALYYQSQHPDVLVIMVSDHDTGGLVVIDDEEQGGLKMGFATREHTAALVPIFATGPGADVFEGVMDNTFIGETLIRYISER